jgi:hypothetical protein
MSLTPPITIRLDDEKAERVRGEHHRKIVEIQGQPFAGAMVVSSVSLANAVVTPVPHRLGRTPDWVGVSVIRGATATGRIVESARDDKFVTLTATGHGATITVDLVVL